MRSSVTDGAETPIRSRSERPTMADPVRGDVPEVEDGPEYDLDFREHPERYRHTDDERGVFKIEPYKSELLPSWGIASLADAEAIHDRYREYRANGDLVGMDMARKYLQMGWTRAMRYAKYPGREEVRGRRRRARRTRAAAVVRRGEARDRLGL